jgi:hypothetical protein
MLNKPKKIAKVFCGPTITASTLATAITLTATTTAIPLSTPQQAIWAYTARQKS